eukprot:295171_1
MKHIICILSLIFIYIALTYAKISPQKDWHDTPQNKETSIKINNALITKYYSQNNLQNKQLNTLNNKDIDGNQETIYRRRLRRGRGRRRRHRRRKNRRRRVNLVGGTAGMGF